MFLSMQKAYRISGFAMALWRVFRMKFNYKFVPRYQKKTLKKSKIYIFDYFLTEKNYSS